MPHLKKIILAGATGSIGQSTISILKKYPDLFDLVAFSYHKNKEYANRISQLFPSATVFETGKKEQSDQLTNILDQEYDIFINAIVGAAGIHLTYKAASQGKTLLLANKESLVMAGDLIIERVKKYNTTLLPVDSEHSSLFRLLMNTRKPKELILTASGGPLYKLNEDEIKLVTLQKVLKHPTWQMGAKISVDSAGLINKALEIIEAYYLFPFNYKQISAVIHPQSHIHAMVMQKDNSIFMHTSPPDMITPIAFALFYPNEPGIINEATLPFNYPNFSFEKINEKKFPGFTLGIKAGEAKNGYPTVFNAANEIAVAAFLNQEIPFYVIPKIIDTVIQKHIANEPTAMGDIFEIDELSRKRAKETISKNKEKF